MNDAAWRANDEAMLEVAGLPRCLVRLVSREEGPGDRWWTEAVDGMFKGSHLLAGPGRLRKLAAAGSPGPPDEPTLAMMLGGVGEWLAESPRSRSATIEVEGGSIKVKVTTAPTLASFTVEVDAANYVGDVGDVLDRALGIAADHPDKGLKLRFSENTGEGA